MLVGVTGDASGHEGRITRRPPIDEIVREGAWRMLKNALRAEVEAFYRDARRRAQVDGEI